MKNIKETLLKKIKEIEDKAQLVYLLSIVNELSEGGNIAEANVVYGKKEEYPVLLTEEQIIGLAEGLQDIRMGRTHTHEEVMEEMKALLKSYK